MSLVARAGRTHRLRSFSPLISYGGHVPDGDFFYFRKQPSVIYKQPLPWLKAHLETHRGRGRKVVALTISKTRSLGMGKKDTQQQCETAERNTAGFRRPGIQGNETADSTSTAHFHCTGSSLSPVPRTLTQQGPTSKNGQLPSILGHGLCHERNPTRLPWVATSDWPVLL